MLDKIPAVYRHAIIVILTAAVTTLAQALTADTFDWKSVAAGVGAAALTQLALILTPLTQQYGVGAPPPPGEPVIETP